jgi:hypothetical protein
MTEQLVSAIDEGDVQAATPVEAVTPVEATL